MRPETRELLKRLTDADWFCSVGQPLDGSVVAVRSWEEAAACCSSPEWSSFALEMDNRLTMDLHAHAHERYQRWNDLVRAVKEDMTPLVQGKLAGVGQASVEVAVRWDLLGACMELEHADVREPGYFCGLMAWYLGGRFPCSWGERDELGHLRLYGAVDESDYDPDEPDWLKLVLAYQDRVFRPKVRLPRFGKLLVY
jgi:hypothetical protein